MKNRLLMRIWAVLLAVCLATTAVSTVQVMMVYASEDEDDDDQDDQDDQDQSQGADQDDDDDDDGGGEIIDPVLPPDPTPPAPVPADYNLTCTTPNIAFGNWYPDAIIAPSQIKVVNSGNISITVGWDESDAKTAFSLTCNSESTFLDAQDTLTFNVVPEDGLRPGPYNARYTFYNTDDPQRTHVTFCDVSVTIKDDAPYITNVTVTPGSVTLSPGKTYTFGASVKGGGSYDPSVTWSLLHNSSAQTVIGQDGTLSVASDEKASSFQVLAVSNQDSDYGDIATVSIVQADHSVSVKADPDGSGAVAGGGPVKDGGSVTLSASPNNNYAFKGWFENGNLVSSSPNPRIDNITCDHNYIARFDRQTCYVRTSVNDSDGGTITDSASVPCGGKMKIKARAKDGYHFDKFVENGSKLSDSDTIELNNITSDRDIKAMFYKDSCKVNVAVNPANTGAVDGGGKYDVGSKVNLQAYPTDGYVFAGWSINGQVVSTSPKYSIDSIKSDVCVIANFMKRGAMTYTITSGIANKGGSITPSGDVAVVQGNSISYTILASPGYKISAVMVDGKNIGPVSRYTFNNVSAVHAIAAAFEKKPVEPSSDGKKKDTTVTVSDKKNESTNTVYNNNTAAEGAVQQQRVVYSDIPEAQSELDPNAYANDVYTLSLDDDQPINASSDTVMAKHNLTEDDIRSMIKDETILPLLREAYDDGVLKITVNNTFAADKQETALGGYYSNPTLTNFEDVIAQTLSEDEIMDVLGGIPVAFNIDISDSNETIDKATKKAMQSMIGYKPLSYFDFVILKTSNGVTTVISDTASELEVVLPIPEKYRKNGRKFCVIRDHNGKVDVLKDIGNDPANVTFRTDEFSQYAIAYEAINVNSLALRFLVISLGSLILALICFVNLVKYKRKARRQHHTTQHA